MTTTDADARVSPRSRALIASAIVLGILAGLSLGLILGRLGPGPTFDPPGRRWGVPAYRVSDVGIPDESGK